MHVTDGRLLLKAGFRSSTVGTCTEYRLKSLLPSPDVWWSPTGNAEKLVIEWILTRQEDNALWGSVRYSGIEFAPSAIVGTST